MTAGLARSLPASAAPEVKFAAAPLAKVSRLGLFEGYASLFGVVDLARDVVAHGAFRESLRLRPPQAVKLLWQHDPAQPLGLWRSIAEDDKGLRVVGELDLSIARAREAHALMLSGAVDGLSIGFRTERARKDPATGVRRLEKLDLWEISIVTFPMLPGARAAAVKAAPPGAPPPLADAIRRAARRLEAAL